MPASCSDPLRILALLTAGPVATVALVVGGRVAAAAEAPGARGLAEALPRMVAEVAPRLDIDVVAALAGPGSFTGLRAGLALGHGLAAGRGIPLVAVTAGEALEAELGVPLLVATDTGRGRFHLECGGRAWAVDATSADLRGADLPLAGDGAPALAALLAARGIATREARPLGPSAVGVAAAALRRRAGALPPRPALPLYVEEAMVTAPATPDRPPPVSAPAP